MVLILLKLLNNMKKLWVALVLVGLVSACSGSVRNEDKTEALSKNPPKVQTVRNPNNNCADRGIKIISPTAKEEISFPIYVEAVVDNTGEKECLWTVFEAQAGEVKAYDTAGNITARGTLKTVEDWMASGPVTYKAILNLEKGPVSKELKVIITEEDPSGLGGGQTVEFSTLLR